MDDLSSYYNTLGDVQNSNLSAQAKAQAEVSEKHEQLKELLVGLGEPLLDDGLVEGFKYVRNKAWATAKRAGRAGADKLLKQYGLSSSDLENYVSEARKGNFSSPRLEELWNSQRAKIEGILQKVKGQNYNPIGNVIPEVQPRGASLLPQGNIIPSRRVDRSLLKSDEKIPLDGDEEIARMSEDNLGAENLYKYRKAYLKKQYQRLSDGEKQYVEGEVREAKNRGDYISTNNANLSNEEKAKNLKVRRDAINEILDDRDVPLLSHTERPKFLTVKSNDFITQDEPIIRGIPKRENYAKAISDIEQDNRVVNFNVLRQDIANGRGVNATRIANKNVNLQKQEFMDNASLDQRIAFNEAENSVHTAIDNLGKTAPETAQAKLEATQNLIHQSVLGKQKLNGAEVADGLEGKIGNISDALGQAGSDLEDTVNTAVSQVKSKVGSTVESGVKGALEKGAEVMAETDVADGGEADPIGDLVGLIAGVGALVGGLYHKKEEAPTVVPLSTSIQLGAGNM